MIKTLHIFLCYFYFLRKPVKKHELLFVGLAFQTNQS